MPNINKNSMAHKSNHYPNGGLEAPVFNSPRVLLFDIETAAIVGTVWGKYEQDLIWEIQGWYMLTFAWKWLGDKNTEVLGLDDFKGFKQDHANDKELVTKLHGLFNEADIIIAHNGKRFDSKKSQSRFFYHGLPPPSPYKQVDTLTEAKKHFSLTSNRLDDIGEYLGVGRKIKTDKDLWKGCMAGDLKAFAKMKRYNKKDVVLLEKVYLKMRPWVSTHPSMALMSSRPSSCPKCGKGPLIKQGTRHFTNVSYAQRFQCRSCGGWSRSRLMTRTDTEFVN